MHITISSKELQVLCTVVSILIVEFCAAHSFGHLRSILFRGDLAKIDGSPQLLLQRCSDAI